MAVLNQITKRIFHLTLKENCEIQMKYVPSKENVTDAPSRSISFTDSMLSEVVCAKVEELYGPHTVDLMALDANAMKASNGPILKHFSPCPLPFSTGVDIFAQDLSKR